MLLNNLQDFMKENFDLSKQLKDFYETHLERRNLIEKQYCAQKNEFKVNVGCSVFFSFSVMKPLCTSSM